MPAYNKYNCRFVAVIKDTGAVEVQKAVSDSILGRVYFKTGTKAFKVATQLIEQGLIEVGRSGWTKTRKGYVQTSGSYYLGSVIVAERKPSASGYELAVVNSRLVNEVCDVR